MAPGTPENASSSAATTLVACLMDGQTDELPESGGKIRILSCRRALPPNDGIARQIEGAHTGSNATVAESQHAVQRATSCLYILGARAGAVLS